jgi:hypothetical protein
MSENSKASSLASSVTICNHTNHSENVQKTFIERLSPAFSGLSSSYMMEPFIPPEPKPFPNVARYKDLMLLMEEIQNA